MILEKNISSKELLDTFEKVLKNLPEREKNVLIKRVWLYWEKETLQWIWNSFSSPITRERVRQIEDSWIKKIWRLIENTSLQIFQEKAKNLIQIHWWVLIKDKIINSIVKDLKIENNVNKNILETIISSSYDLVKSKPKIWTRTYFYSPKFDKKLIDFIYKEALSILKKRKDVINMTSLAEQIKINLKIPQVQNIVIFSSLEIFEDIVFWEENLIGLTKWKILNPKTLKDKAIYVLKKEKIPIHFIEISNKISSWVWEKIKVNTIHNELIRNKEFVLVWRWIYALKEWWIYKPWNVIDVIVDIIKKTWPITTEDIIKKVLKVRQVKPTTIYMNLQNKEIIQRVWRNFYDLKDKKED